MVWVICALGLNIVVGYAGLLDLGFVAFWAIGGYIAGWLMSGFVFGSATALPRAAPAGRARHPHQLLARADRRRAASAPSCGILIGAPTLRLKSDYLALVTLGFGEIIPQFFRNGDDIFGHNLDQRHPGHHAGRPDHAPGPELHSSGPFDLDVPVRRLSRASWRSSSSSRCGCARPARPGLAGDPRGRAGGQHDGRPADADQARRPTRVGAVAGGLGGVAFAAHINGVSPGPVQLHHLDHPAGDGRAGRHGQRLGCHGRRAGAGAGSTPRACTQLGDDVQRRRSGPTSTSRRTTTWFFGLILVLMMLFRREGLIPEARTKLLLREPDRGPRSTRTASTSRTLRRGSRPGGPTRRRDADEPAPVRSADGRRSR